MFLPPAVGAVSTLDLDLKGAKIRTRRPTCLHQVPGTSGLRFPVLVLSDRSEHKVLRPDGRGSETICFPICTADDHERPWCEWNVSCRTGPGLAAELGAQQFSADPDGLERVDSGVGPDGPERKQNMFGSDVIVISASGLDPGSRETQATPRRQSRSRGIGEPSSLFNVARLALENEGAAGSIRRFSHQGMGSDFLPVDLVPVNAIIRFRCLGALSPATTLSRYESRTTWTDRLAGIETLSRDDDLWIAV